MITMIILLLISAKKNQDYGLKNKINHPKNKANLK